MSIDMYLSQSEHQYNHAKYICNQYTNSFKTLESTIHAIINNKGALSGKAYQSIFDYYNTALIPLSKGISLLSSELALASRKIPNHYIDQVYDRSLKESDLLQDIANFEQLIIDIDDIIYTIKTTMVYSEFRTYLINTNERIKDDYRSSLTTLEKRLNKLLEFNYNSKDTFSTFNQILDSVNRGLKASTGKWNSQTKSYDLSSINESGWIEEIHETIKKRSVFGSANGRYGSDQGYLIYQWEYGSIHVKKDLKDMAERIYGRVLTDEEIELLFSILDAEGCGYAAGTNIIMSLYEGREAEFEDAFGISFFNKHGDVNFEEFLLLYYYKENDMRDIIFTDKQMYFPHPGATGRSVKSNVIDFLRETGVDLKITELSLMGNNVIRGKDKKDISKYEGRKDLLIERVNNGELVVLTTYFIPMKLTTLDGKQIDSTMHSVTITGYDENTGYFTVSSWGKEYYLTNVPYASGYYSYMVGSDLE